MANNDSAQTGQEIMSSTTVQKHPGQFNESDFLNDVLTRLEVIYSDDCQSIANRLLEVARKYYPFNAGDAMQRWSEEDVLLITYGDSLVDKGETPLTTLGKFLSEYLSESVSGVHIIPFFPYSSDDGFSVIDYRQVDPRLGSWDEVNAIAADFKLMVDLVINHISRESLWFADFVSDIAPARDYFIDMPAETDVSMVTRPRSTPLLVPVNTHRGIRHVWATFSEDQIDLNFANPDVLLEFVDILLYYLANGARLIRLDAIAFLWKQPGTNCIHLQQTHEVVKLLRDILDHLAPDSILLTETNVPHKENLSYFGNGDEAHMVYQFSLPPLVLHALNRGTAVHLSKWASELPQLPPQCTYLNFTASHDGIGLRALEGILAQREVEDLIDSMRRFGGFVSMKANPDGIDTPYEINISLFDAMQGTRRGADQWQVSRFICSQAMMLALQGIPAVYIHSILATPNDVHGVELTGRTRSINRKKWHYDELICLLESQNTPNHEVFHTLRRLIQLRREQVCFHPDNPQEVIEISSGIFALLRTELKSQRGSQPGSDKKSAKRLLALHNVTCGPQAVAIKNRPDLSDSAQWYDLVSEQQLPDTLATVMLQPYQVMWLIEPD